MALRVWLPLNGNLENKGVSDVTIGNGNYTIENSGKIGKCIKTSSNSSINGIDLGYNGNIINTGDLSLGGWFKFNQSEISTAVMAKTFTSSATTATGNLIGNDSYGGIGLIWNSNNIYSSNAFSSMNVFAALRTPTVNQNTTSITIEFDKWVHLFLTWNRTTKILSFYKDGILINSKTFTDFSDAASRNFLINYAGIYGGNGPGTLIPYYINDVRIYDHCLSPKEVKEISQGLVLHYKLNQLSQGSGQNLVVGLTSGGQTTVVNDTIVTSGQNSDTYFRIKLSSALELNKSYTMGIDAENLPDGGYFRFPIGSQSNSSAGYIDIYNGHNEIVFIANDVIVNCGTSLMMDDNTRTAWPNQCIFKNFYIYENTGIADSSGYEHDGTIIGALTTDTNTFRYNLSAKQAASDLIEAPYNPIGSNSFTVSGWFYRTGGACTYYAAKNVYETYVCLESGRYFIYNSSGSPHVGNWTSAQNTWQYIVLVNDASNKKLKLYVNGAFISEVTTDGTIYGSDILNIGGRQGTGSYVGLINDFRIYATALSAEDILDLYHTPANIDNLNNLHGFEFIEDNEKDSIYKNGIISNGKNINYLVNNFAETNTITNWSFGGTSSISNGIVTMEGVNPAFNSSTFNVNPDDIIAIEIGLQLTTVSTTTSGPGVYIGTKYGQSTSTFYYNFATNTWVANNANNTNPYFIHGYNSTDYYHCKTYILGSNKTINDIPDAKASNTRTLYAIKLNSDTTTNIRSGYNSNTTMTIKLSDFKIYNLNQHGIAQVDNSAKTGYGYLQYNGFIEK